MSAVTVDVRGYGRSSKPSESAEYRMTRLVEANVANVRALGVENAIVVGHDWGSPIAANTALLGPDVVVAVALHGFPDTPRGGPRPPEVFAGIGGDAE
jgi:pimeloyl-ACP methyl ester carboxylesterase